MKGLIILCAGILFIYTATAQPSADTSAPLVAQKENIITASTIIKIENLGFNINSELPELRPTISADGNLFFLFAKITATIQNIIPFPTRRTSGIPSGIAMANGAKRCTWIIR